MENEKQDGACRKKREQDAGGHRGGVNLRKTENNRYVHRYRGLPRFRRDQARDCLI